MTSRSQNILRIMTHKKVVRKKRVGNNVIYILGDARVLIPLRLDKKIDTTKGRKYLHDIIVMYDELFMTNFGE